jgi:hypothetical protein
MTITERAERARDRATGRNRRPWASSLLVAGAAAAAGAAIAFLTDPARGRARRARLFDQGSALARHGWRRAERTIRAVGSTAEGKLEALSEGGHRVAPVDDVTLRDRAETELFRDPKVPKGTINLSVERDPRASWRSAECEDAEPAGARGLVDRRRLERPEPAPPAG